MCFKSSVALLGDTGMELHGFISTQGSFETEHLYKIYEGYSMFLYGESKAKGNLVFEIKGGGAS